MAYTVRQVARMSGVSVRTLHFYDEAGLLKPAYVGANGYRFYDEPQLLILQQILFYRELGFELKRIKEILGRADFEKITALESHRQLLESDLTRTRTLIETIDKTLKHLKGIATMKTDDMFIGFTVAAGKDRFGKKLKLGEGFPVNCKVSATDTNGSMAIFEFTTGWPHHLHHEQDEWVYILEGEWQFIVGTERFKVGPGESVFIPRKVPHLLGPVNGDTGKIIHVFQPAGNMEEFFRVTAQVKDLPTRDQVINNECTNTQIENLCRVFAAHGMDLLPLPPDPFNLC